MSFYKTNYLNCECECETVMHAVHTCILKIAPSYWYSKLLFLIPQIGLVYNVMALV